MSCNRGGCPLYPEDGGAPPGQVVSLTGACRSSAASPYTPSQLPIDGASLTRHQRGFKQFTRPAFPSPAATGWNGCRFGFPPGFAPRRPGADDARRGGDRPSSTDLKLLAQHHIRVDPPIGSSLTTCDLASHDESEQPRAPSGWLLDRQAIQQSRAASRSLLLRVGTGPAVPASSQRLSPEPRPGRRRRAARARRDRADERARHGIRRERGCWGRRAEWRRCVGNRCFSAARPIGAGRGGDDTVAERPGAPDGQTHRRTGRSSVGIREAHQSRGRQVLLGRGRSLGREPPTTTASPRTALRP